MTPPHNLTRATSRHFPYSRRYHSSHYSTIHPPRHEDYDTRDATAQQESRVVLRIAQRTSRPRWLSCLLAQLMNTARKDNQFHGAELFLRNLSRRSPYFAEPEDLLKCLHKLTTGPYSESNISSQHRAILFM